MKFLQEILNIYDLHQNPEQLTGFDKPGNRFAQGGGWSFLYADNPRWTSSDPSYPAIITNTGKSSATKAIQAMMDVIGEDFLLDGGYAGANPYTPAQFKKITGNFALIFMQYAKADKVTEYKSVYAQFLKSVSQLQPLSIIDFGSPGPGSSHTIGVIELPPSIVENAIDSVMGDFQEDEPDGDDMRW